MPNGNLHPPGVPAACTVAPRLVARLYAASGEAVRAQLLHCLLRHLGLLGAVAAAAAAAFSSMVLHPGSNEVLVRVDDLRKISTDQVFELARFAQQVNPDALRQVARLVSQHQAGRGRVHPRCEGVACRLNLCR